MKLFKGGQVLDSETISADPATVYSNVFYVTSSNMASFHLVVDDDASSLAITVTLWASNKPNPSLTDDTDWVQMTSSHGYDGLPNGNPTGGDTKDLVDLGNLGAAVYRFKFERTAGSGTLDGWVAIKDNR